MSVVISAVGVWACSSDDPAPSTPRRNDSGTNTDPDSSTPNDPLPDAGNPSEVTITYGTCPAFTPCGGDVTGQWKVSGGCISSEALAPLKARCPGAQESDVVIKATGAVNVTATTVERKTTVNLSGKVTAPKECVDQVGGSCVFLQVALSTELVAGQPPPFDSAACTATPGVPGGCTCTVARKLAEDTTDSYTVSGNVLTTNNPPRRFEYCVNGNKNTYREATDGGIPVILEITK